MSESKVPFLRFPRRVSQQVVQSPQEETKQLVVLR